MSILDKQKTTTFSFIKENEYGIDIQEEINKEYRIIDAALWDDEINTAFSLADQNCSLFAVKGKDIELVSVTPYLFECTKNEEFNKWIRHKEQKGLRSLYISSEMSFEQLRKHLRNFLRMKKENGKYIYFRFYDPYVVNTIFPKLDKEQLSEFFENINYIITDDIRINERRIFYLSSEKELQIQHQVLEEICG